MKVAYLLGSLNRGGTETLLLDLFRNSKSQGLNAIGIYRKSGVLEHDFQESGLTINKLSNGKNLVGYILRLRKLLLGNHVTIAHAQQPIDALYAWLACVGSPIKVLLTFHGYDFSYNKPGNLILRFIIRRTDTNIYVSDAQRHYYQEKYHLNPGKQKVVYNGIFFDKLNVPETTNSTLSNAPGTDTSNQIIASSSLRDELRLSSNTLLFGSVGNFVPGRDQMTLCRFLKLLQKQHIDFHFVFVGKRTDKVPQLHDDCFNFCEQNSLSDKVSFLGSRNDVPSILHRLDAFFFATDHDTFGIAVVEAMAVGIPVFVNDWGVMSEITEKGKYATLYKTKDEQDLLRHFLLFLQNKALYQDKARQASLFVRERYSIEKHIETLKEVYNKMIYTD